MQSRPKPPGQHSSFTTVCLTDSLSHDQLICIYKQTATGSPHTLKLTDIVTSFISTAGLSQVLHPNAVLKSAFSLNMPHTL